MRLCTVCVSDCQCVIVCIIYVCVCVSVSLYVCVSMCVWCACLLRELKQHHTDVDHTHSFTQLQPCGVKRQLHYYVEEKKLPCLFNCPRRVAGVSDVFPPVWNLRTVSLIPLFYYIYISSIVLLPSPVALSVLFYSAFGPFS